MKTQTKTMTTLGLLGLTVSGAALAQTTDKSADHAGLETVLVTAQKRTERLQDVPISISTQSAEQLTAAGVRDTKDLTKAVPGLIFAQNQSISQPAIRGVTGSITVAGGENPIGFYLDNVYQPSTNGILFDLPDVERIEVLKGPQGTLFGRNATGGAIRVFTKEPSYEPTGKLSVTDGYYTGRGASNSAHEARVSGFLNGPLIDDVLAVSASGFYRNNPGYLHNLVNDERIGDTETYGGRIKLMWEPSENAKIVLSGNYMKLDDETTYANSQPLNGVTRAGEFPDAIIPFKPWAMSWDPDNIPYLHTENWGMSLRGEFDLGVGTLSALTGYTVSDNKNFVEGAQAFSPLCYAAFACNSFDYAVYNKSFSQEINFASEEFGIFSVTGGVFYYRSPKADQVVTVYTGASRIPVFRYNDIVETTSYSAFTEINADVTERLRLIVGGRFTHEKLEDGGATVNGGPAPKPSLTSEPFTMRASAIYSFDDHNNIYFTYSEGFKSGALGPASQVDRTPIRPEKLNSYELGFKTAYRDFSFNAAYFHYDYSNLQLTKYIDTLAIPTNAGSAELDGFDVDATYRATPDLTLNVAFNYTPTAKFTDYEGAPFYYPPNTDPGINCAPKSTDPTSRPCIFLQGDGTGLRMIRIPKFSGTVSANWEHEYSFGKLGANVSLYHASEIKWDIIGSIVGKPYDDLNARLSYTVNNVELAVFGRNLLNESELIGSQPAPFVLPAFRMPPQQIGVSLEYSF